MIEKPVSNPETHSNDPVIIAKQHRRFHAVEQKQKQPSKNQRLQLLARTLATLGGLLGQEVWKRVSNGSERNEVA